VACEAAIRKFPFQVCVSSDLSLCSEESSVARIRKRHGADLHYESLRQSFSVALKTAIAAMDLQQTFPDVIIGMILELIHYTN